MFSFSLSLPLFLPLSLFTLLCLNGVSFFREERKNNSNMIYLHFLWNIDVSMLKFHDARGIITFYIEDT